MLGRRICYLLGVVSCFVFFLFYKEWFSWLLLMGVLWLPVFSLLISLPALYTEKFQIHAPEEVRAGMPARASLGVDCLFPRLPMRCKIRLHNRLTGERYTGMPGELIPTDHCGKMTMECTGLWVYDYLGLWRFSKKAQLRETVHILPRSLPDRHIPSPEQMPVRSWKVKPGGGVAENYDLRPYRPGDELRQIHWKVSAKVGRLIYREAMEPAQKQVVLTLTLSGTPEQLDRKLGRVYGVSGQLLSRGAPHIIYCRTAGGILTLEVTDQKSQEQAIRSLIGGEPTQGEADLSIHDALWQCRIGGGPDEA